MRHIATFILLALIADSASSQSINERHKLLASDGAAADWYGHSVAIDGSTALVGAASDDDNGNDESGSAYVYDVATGQELAKLLASDGAENDRFGRALAVDGNTAIVGAYFHDDIFNGVDSGATQDGCGIGSWLVPPS